MKKEYCIKGEFFYEIVDNKTKKVIVKSKKQKNIILNQGLDFLAIRSFVENTAYCAVGSSVVGPLYTDTGLVGEFDRTNNLDTSVPIYANTTLSGNVYSFIRVFKFDTSVNPASYGTLGLSYTGTSGNNLFSKAIILTATGGAGPVVVNNGQYLRVYYTINVTINPSTATSGNSNIINLPAADGGTYGLQLIGLKSINTNNVIGFWDAGQDCNELYSSTEIFLSTSNSALSSFGSSTNRSSGTNYTIKASTSYAGPGSGVTFKRANFGKNVAVNTINSMGIGVIGSSFTNSGFAYVFNNGQSKGGAFNLAPIFTYSIVSHS